MVSGRMRKKNKRVQTQTSLIQFLVLNVLLITKHQYDLNEFDELNYTEYHFGKQGKKQH